MLKNKRLTKIIQLRSIIFLLVITIATNSLVGAFPLSPTFAATYSPLADEESCLALSELGAVVRWDQGSFGVADCVVTGGTLEIGADDIINIDVTARRLIIESSASVVNYGHITLTQGSEFIFRGSTFENRGTVEITNAGLFAFVQSASFKNYGEIILSSGYLSFTSNSVGSNQGTIEVNSNALIEIGAGEGASPGTFTNSGIININEGGTIRIDTGTFTNTCEGTLNNNGGTIEGTIIDECSPIQLIDKLTNYVNGLDYLKNKNPLLNPLKDARRLLSDSNTNNDKGACGDLKDFISTVNNLQKSGKIKSQDASNMIEQANKIMTVLKC